LLFSEAYIFEIKGQEVCGSRGIFNYSLTQCSKVQVSNSCLDGPTPIFKKELGEAFKVCASIHMWATSDTVIHLNIFRKVNFGRLCLY